MKLLVEKDIDGRLSRDELLVYNYAVLNRLPVRSVARESVSSFDLTLAEFALTLDYLPVGSISFVHDCLRKLNINVPDLSCYPSSLKGYLCRDIYTMSLGDALNLNKAVFIKPCRCKLFTGGVVGGLKIDEIVNTERVYVCDPVSFQCEYRYYVLDGRILGSSFYSGDESIGEPDLSVVQSAVDAYSDAPAAYSLDFGLMAGSTVLVEANDGYSLACYSLPIPDYLRFLEARYSQILG